MPQPLPITLLSGIDQHEHELQIAEPPFAAPLPRPLLAALLALCVCALAVALWAGERLPRLRRWELSLWSLLRTSSENAARRSGAAVSGEHANTRRWRRRALTRAPAALALLALALLPLTRWAQRLDVPLLCIAWGSTQLLALPPEPHALPWWRRALGRLLTAIDALWPLLALTLLAVHHTASLGWLDISRAQRGAEWTALSSPWASALTLAWLWQIARQRSAMPAQHNEVLTHLAHALGLALLITVACAGYEPPFGQSAQAAAWVAPLAWLSKIALAAALIAGCTRWRLRAFGRDVELARAPQPALWLFALAALALQWALGAEAAWLTHWTTWAPWLVACALTLLLARALSAGPSERDELPQQPLL